MPGQLARRCAAALRWAVAAAGAGASIAPFRLSVCSGFFRFHAPSTAFVTHVHHRSPQTSHIGMQAGTNCLLFH